ncbi:MAG TPA: hypothetical protein VM409_05655 [Chloroflexia bacterium]|nr:hypothetical protein [Chloroflexia bacterium]
MHAPSTTPGNNTLPRRNTFRGRYIDSHKTALVALLAVALLYLSALLSMPPDGLTHHDTGAKYLQVRNLRLTPAGLDWSINYPARPLDPQLQFVPFNTKQHTVDSQGRIHLQWPIFLGLLSRIPWKVMGFWGLYVVPLLAGLGASWATYLLALRVGVPRRVAWVAVPLLGLSTPVAVYSLLFFEHTLAAVLVTLSLLAGAAAVQQGGARLYLLTGAMLALAIYFRSELYVLALDVGAVYLALGLRDRAWWRRLMLWGAGLVLALIPLWAFYVLTEGTFIPLHATWYFAGSEASPAGPPIGVPVLRYITRAGWGFIPDALLGPEGFPLTPVIPFWARAAGLVGVGLCAGAALLRLWDAGDRLLRARLSLLTLGLGAVALAATPVLFSPQPYSNLHGFLMASPFVLLAVWPGYRHGQAKGAISPAGWLYAVTLLYVGMHLLIISAFSGLGPISSHEWGQRYLLPAYPALVALALHAGSSIWSKLSVERTKDAMWAFAAACVLLAGIGLGFSMRGYTVLAEERRQVVGWMQLARQSPAREPLVTDVWWLPLNLAADFYSRPIMLAEGNTRLAAWATQMRSEGVLTFSLMSTKRDVFDGEWSREVPGLSREGPAQESRGMWLQRFRLAQER